MLRKGFRAWWSVRFQLVRYDADERNDFTSQPNAFGPSSFKKPELSFQCAKRLRSDIICGQTAFHPDRICNCDISVPTTIIALSECWMAPREKCIARRLTELVVSAFRFIARSGRNHTIYELGPAAERGMDMHIICRSSHCRQYTSDVEYVFL